MTRTPRGEMSRHRRGSSSHTTLCRDRASGGIPRADRGWEIPANENPEDEGFYLRYPDGYISWSPKVQFEDAYRSNGQLNFGHALEAMKSGFKLARKSWHKSGMFVVMMPHLHLPPYNSQEPGAKVNDRTARYIGKDTPLYSQEYFAIYIEPKWQPGWLPSAADLCEEDWLIVE